MEQDVVDDALIGQRQRPQFRRQREHDVEVGDVEQFRLPRFQPSCAGGALALGTVSIAT